MQIALLSALDANLMHTFLKCNFFECHFFFKKYNSWFLYATFNPVALFQMWGFGRASQANQTLKKDSCWNIQICSYCGKILL